MPLNDDQREELENCIFDAHFSAMKFLETQKDLHLKFFSSCLDDVLEFVSFNQADLADDESYELYKIHIFVILHLFRYNESRALKNE